MSETETTHSIYTIGTYTVVVHDQTGNIMFTDKDPLSSLPLFSSQTRSNRYLLLQGTEKTGTMCTLPFVEGDQVICDKRKVTDDASLNWMGGEVNKVLALSLPSIAYQQLIDTYTRALEDNLTGKRRINQVAASETRRIEQEKIEALNALKRPILTDIVDEIEP